MAAPVYWIGQDGNIYYGSGVAGAGVINAGPAASANPTASGFTDPWAAGNGGTPLQFSATQIADPLAPPTTTTSGTDKSNDIAVQQAAIGAAGTQETSGKAAVDKELADLMGNYDTEAAANTKTYGTQSDTNRSNLEANKESALVNAQQGRRGLMGTLASLGALSGSGIDLADRAVQQGANEDLTGAQGTFGQNQTALDAAIAKFKQEDAQRRKDAQSAAAQSKQKVVYNAAKARQDAYTALSNDYGAEGNSVEADAAARQAASLYPTLAANSVPDTSNFGYTAAAFTPGTLQNYIAGTGDTTVTAGRSVNNGRGGVVLPALTASDNKQKKSALVA